MVVAPAELVEVALEPAARDLLVVPSDARFEVPKEPLHGVRVPVADDVFAGGVANSTMVEPEPSKGVIGRPFVCVDDGLGADPFDHGRGHLGAAPGLKYGGLDAPSALHSGDHGCSTTLAVQSRFVARGEMLTRPSLYGGFVHFDGPVKLFAVVGHELVA